MTANDYSRQLFSAFKLLGNSSCYSLDKTNVILETNTFVGHAQVLNTVIIFMMVDLLLLALYLDLGCTCVLFGHTLVHFYPISVQSNEFWVG